MSEVTVKAPAVELTATQVRALLKEVEEKEKVRVDIPGHIYSYRDGPMWLVLDPASVKKAARQLADGGVTVAAVWLKARTSAGVGEVVTFKAPSFERGFKDYTASILYPNT